MKMLSDVGSTPTGSTITMALARNGRSSFIARDLCVKACSIKAFGLSNKLSQTHLRSFQTQKTGDETGGFTMVLGMKREDFDSFELGESE